MENVSVIIPAYNREKTIERCVRSIMNQSVPVYEIIVVDDGSSDCTIEIINKLSCDYLRVLKQNHRGAQAARNLGILNAKGDYIAFLDSDDEWLPDLLEELINGIRDTGYCVAYSDCYVIEKEKKTEWNLPGNSGDMYKFLLQHPGPTFSSLLVRRDLFTKIGYLDERVVAYQEWDTVIRLSKYGQFIHVCKPLFNYYRDGETISKDKKKDIDGKYYIIRKHAREIKKHCGIKALYVHYCGLFHSSRIKMDIRFIFFGFYRMVYGLLTVISTLKQNLKKNRIYEKE